MAAAAQIEKAPRLKRNAIIGARLPSLLPFRDSSGLEPSPSEPQQPKRGGWRSYKIMALSVMLRRPHCMRQTPALRSRRSASRDTLDSRRRIVLCMMPSLAFRRPATKAISTAHTSKNAAQGQPSIHAKNRSGTPRTTVVASGEKLQWRERRARRLRSSACR